MTRIIGNETVLSVFLINELSVMLFRTKHRVRRNTRPEAIRHMTLAAGFFSSEKRRLLVSQFWPNFSRHCPPNQLNRNLDIWVSFSNTIWLAMSCHVASDSTCSHFFTHWHHLSVYLLCIYVIHILILCLFCVWCIGLSCVWRSWCSWCSCSLDSGSLQRGELTLHVSQGGVPHLLWFALKTEEFQVSTALWYLGSLEVSCSPLKWAVQRHCTFSKSANHFFFVTVLSCQALETD